MKKRGAHFTRRIDPQAGLHAISMLHRLNATQQADLGVALRFSLESIRTGRATEQEFHTLAACINVSLVLCERGVAADYLPAVKLAQAGLLRLLKRGRESGRWVFDGPGMQDVLHGIELHEAQLAFVTRKEAAEAMREVMRRIDRGDVFEEQRT
ncbi:MAG: hypothetical protein M0Q15_15990 [Nevskia sp.]|jgi:hypothetical protein|nr:hypothetical protein [Nevskia sp.]